MNKVTLTFVLIVVLVLAVFATLQFGLNPGVAQASSSSSSSSFNSNATSTTTTNSTGGASSSGSSQSTGSQQIGGGRIKHVIIIVMENEGYGSVIGNPSAPYENRLASNYSLAANYFAVLHPSLPNYLALVAGDTLGVSSNCFPSQCTVQGTTIATLLDSNGLSWKEYAESMPGNCSQSDSQDGLYVTRHDPFVYFQGVTGNSGSGGASALCKAHVVQFAQFSSDLATSNLPSYSFITPNICDDAHSCALSFGDQWLSTLVPRIVNSSSFASTALFIVYDEGSDSAGFGSNSGGHVACILVSPFGKQGYVSNAQYSHYSLLSTVESIFGTGNLGRNDATAGTMSDMFSAVTS